MSIQSLYQLSPLDGRYSEKLAKLRPILSEYGLFYFRTLVEVEWFKFLFHNKIITSSELSNSNEIFLNNIIASFSINDAERIKEIERTINHDVKAVEYFIKEKLSTNAELQPLAEWIHFACTSEDINNLAYALMFKTAGTEVLFPELQKMIGFLEKLAHENVHVPMLSRTHGQAASPTSVGKEFANFHQRLARQLKSLHQCEFLGKFNGAVGNYNAHQLAFPNINWPELSKKFVEKLGLTFNAYTTQIEPHDYLAEIFHNVMRVNSILIDLNRDVWGYISLNYFGQKLVDAEVGSSTMPHKVNPIDFENSEGNLSLANAIFDMLAQRLTVSRWQRDLVDSTLLRNVAVAMGHAYLAWQVCLKGLQKLQINDEIIAADLANHPEVLAEAVQTIMRARGIEQAYEKLKALTRGKTLTIEMLREFVTSLPLSSEDRNCLLTLEPKNYIGFAEILVNHLK